MPDWWSWTAMAVGLLAAVLLIPVVWLIVRRRWLAGRGRVDPRGLSILFPAGGALTPRGLRTVDGAVVGNADLLGLWDAIRPVTD